MPMFVHHQHRFDRPPHTEVFIVVLQALQAGCNRRIFFRLCVLCCESESRDWVERQGLRHDELTFEMEIAGKYGLFLGAIQMHKLNCCVVPASRCSDEGVSCKM